jgi:hypothetical protein
VLWKGKSAIATVLQTGDAFPANAKQICDSLLRGVDRVVKRRIDRADKSGDRAVGPRNDVGDAARRAALVKSSWT